MDGAGRSGVKQSWSGSNFGNNYLDSTCLEAPRWNDGEIVMLSVFGDESHDSSKARVFAVAGLLGSGDDWETFRQRWRDRLGNIVFHAADCESGHGDFREMLEADRLQLHRDLTKILADSKLMGYGAAIDLAGCRKVNPSVMADFPDMPYYDCFVKTVVYLSNLSAVFIPRDRVEFTFDQHRETQYNAGILYDWITAYKPHTVEKISFATRKEPGVQAADLWARELMKRCDTHLFNERANPRPQWKTIINTKRFKFGFTVGHQFAETMKQMETMPVIDHADYEQWRVNNKLVDNLSHRFRYFARWDIGRE